MGEAVNDVFIVVIARAWVPSDHQLRFGTQLHHALRHCGARESTAAERARLVGLRADERIHILGVVVGALRAEEEGQQQEGHQQRNVFHDRMIYKSKSTISSRKNSHFSHPNKTFPIFALLKLQFL